MAVAALIRFSTAHTLQVSARQEASMVEGSKNLQSVASACGQLRAPGRVLFVTDTAVHEAIVEQMITALEAAGLDVEVVFPNDFASVVYEVPVDLVLVRMRSFDMRPLAWTLRHRASMGNPETVTLVDSLRDPSAQSLGALGVRFVLPLHDCRELLVAAAPHFVAITRARRAQLKLASLLAAATAIPDHAEAQHALPSLYQAERHFREAYVRSVLSISSSRKDAADNARIPYRTFCQILNDLGIPDPAVEDQRQRSHTRS